ncbi:LysR family transcriptional regulator ArgP [Rheinheimera sp. F8]|uniref:LysR family transcriptional regulator ArgP n=1 Tax=Rheinheimera sp. F8 TaxID=1763998 RepID=UPI0007449AF9|nr:LysR family transcriptional regulator ArgP [Rheinheimera sp. F8]ALZ75745.1 LysR family transcriptional regulator [Rheinheimera sp. F8]
MLDYRLLQALAAVTAQGGFEKAAAQLHLTQSAISRRIKQLEAVLGQPVLQRSTPPKPTLAGQRLLNHLQQVRQMEAALGLADQEVQLLRLATNADSLATWLPQALVLPDQPQLCFDLVVEDQSVSLKRMKQGDVMACICDSPQPLNGGAVMPLGALRYRAVASPDFVRRYQLQPLSAALLAQAPCLVFSSDDALQHRFLQDIAGISPSHVHLCPSSEGFLKAVLAGLGFGLLPELQMQAHFANGELIDLAPGYYLDTPLYWHHWQTESPLLQQLRLQVLAGASQCLVPIG